MNQRGDTTLTSLLFLLGLTALLGLSALELQNSFRLLKKRTHLFLCAKDAKGELDHFLKFMGRTNWAIKNIEKAKMVMLVIPGLQGGAFNAHKARKILISMQNLRLIPYLKKMSLLQARGCPLDPRVLQTPFQLSHAGFARGSRGEAQLRSHRWSYQFMSSPYYLELKIDATRMTRLKPKLSYVSGEKGARLSFRSSLR